MSPPKRPRKTIGTSAFTVVELMVVIAILSIMAITIAISLHAITT